MRSPHLAMVIHDTYTLWLWLDTRVTDFPVTARREHGRHVLDAVLALLDGNRPEVGVTTGRARRGHPDIPAVASSP